MMGRYKVIIRFIINTICIVLLLWGSDIAYAAPEKPKVVRKKIVEIKDQISKIQTEKIVPAAETSEAATPEKTQEALVNEQPAAVTEEDKLRPIADKAATTSAQKIVSKPLPQKKTAINPKSDISEIKQLIEIQKPSMGDKTVQSGEVAAGATKTNSTTPSAGIPQVYDFTGKVDPFEPLVREKPVVVRKSKRKKRIPRTPLERIDLSQLKLVGIITASSGNRALVEESTGKGYVIKRGTYIGTSSGKVVNIQKEKVIVEEEFEDVAGKIKTRQREIKLPKPPGEF